MLQGKPQQLARKGLPRLRVCSEVAGQSGNIRGQRARTGAQGLRILLRKFRKRNRRAVAFGIPVNAVALGIVLRLGEQGGMIRPELLQQDGFQLFIAVGGKYALAGKRAHLTAQTDRNAGTHGLPPADSLLWAMVTGTPAERKNAARLVLTMARLDCL